MLIGRNPFPNKIIHSIMSTLQETVYRNDSVLFNLNINYDLKACFITNFSLTKSKSRNLSLLWNIDTFLKPVHAK